MYIRLGSLIALNCSEYTNSFQFMNTNSSVACYISFFFICGIFMCIIYQNSYMMINNKSKVYINTCKPTDNLTLLHPLFWRFI